MNIDAIAIANYFIDKSKMDTKAPCLTLLRLVKYVYIAHGFALAILNRTIIDKRFDVVEAWKFGPVIPSVYHTFKHNSNNPITSFGQIAINETPDGRITFITPQINDAEIKNVLDFVWNRYSKMSTGALINTLHKEGTPWKFCYQEGKNMIIPDEMTCVYYKEIVKVLLNEC